MENHKFVNFGLGVMTEQERQYLLDNKAIVNKFGVDHIACDAFCVNTLKNGEATCVFQGTEMQCAMEADKIRRERSGIKVVVCGYSKFYFEWMDSKKQKMIQLEEASDEFDNLVKNI